MVETQAVYFILGAVALALLIIALTGEDVLGSVIGNLTQSRTGFSVVCPAGGCAAEAGYQQSGDLYAYTIKTSPHFQISPKPKEDINVFAVVSFKDKHAVAKEFVVQRGEERHDEQVEATVTSYYPPLSEAFPGSITFAEGQEYALRAGAGTFRVGMTGINLRVAFSGLLPQPECKARFRAECKDAVRSTSELEACSEGFDERCSKTLLFESNPISECSGSVTITVRNADCNEKSAEADIEAEGGVEWSPSEQATVLFFRKSGCVELNKDVESWRGSCPNDLLGASTMDVHYV